MKTKTVFFLVLGAVAAVAAVSVWWVRCDAERASVANVLPRPPELANASTLLRAQVEMAEQKARSRFTSLKGLSELARLYDANGFFDEASRCYEGLEKLTPKDARAFHRHATILAGYGEINAAIELWRRVLVLAPDYIPARLRLADCELKMNRQTAAATDYSGVLVRRPDNAYAQLGLARIALEAGRDDEATTRLEQVVQQTRYQLGYDLIVTLYERTGRKSQADAIRGKAAASGAYRDARDPWLDELLDFCFDPYRLCLAAGVLASAEPDQAKRLLLKAVEIDPKDVSSQFQLGNFYADHSNIEAAREQFQRCTRLTPSFSDGWYRLSVLEEQSGDKVAAERALADGLQNCPQSPGLHLLRAQRLRTAGRWSAAINEFLISIQLRPNEPEASIELASLYIEHDRTEEGIAQLRQALTAEPENPTALGILTFHAISSGDETSARQLLQRVDRQPRMDGPHVEQLKAAYRAQFGRDWNPDR